MPRAKRQHLKRRSDGRYACRYKDKWFMGYTEDEALSAREEYKRQEQAGEAVRSNPTVAEYAAKWLPLYKTGVSEKCYADYRKQLDALEPIGSTLIRDVTADDARTVYLHFKGYSQSTIKRARMLYIAMFDTAVENDLIRKNPFRGKFAQPDRGHEGTHRTISEEERDLILAVPHRMRTGALLMLYAGLRRGEALALKYDDIKDGWVTVSQAVRFNGNAPILTDPKTEAGKRRVPIPMVIKGQLHGEGWVIPSAKGQQCTETAFSRGWENYMTVLSRAAGHPISIRCHDLRHSYCTMLRDAGVDMHQAMQWMGHADEKMILRIYDHITNKRTTEEQKKVEKILSGRQNGRQTKRKKPRTR